MFKSLLKLWPFLSPYKKSIIFAIVTGVFMAQIQVLLPVAIKLLVDALDPSQNMIDQAPQFIQNLPFWPTIEEMLRDNLMVVKCVAIFLPIYFFAYGILRFVHFYTLVNVSERMGNDVRFSVMNRFLSLSPTFYQNVKSGSGGLLSRTLADTMVIRGSIHFYFDLIREPLFVLFLASYLLYLNWQITLFTLISIPIFSFIIRKITRKLKSLSHMGQSALDDVAKNLKEGLDGIRIIQSYTNEDYVRGRFRQKIDYYNSIQRKIIKRMEMASPLNEFIASLFVGAIIYWIGYRITSGQDTVGDFMAFITTAGAINTPIKKIQQSLVKLPSVSVSIQRIFEIINSTEEVKQIEKPKSLPKEWSRIEYKNVGFKYGEQSILKSISFTAERGQVLAFVGESGSGKTTVMNLLERFFDPAEGEILIDGININQLFLKELRDEIALVTQEVFLFDDTVENNIRAGNMNVSTKKVIEAAKKANAYRFIESLPDGMQTLCGERGSKFSGGEKQRISIARAILKNSPILIMDEATSALDSASEVEVQEGLESLMKGRTTFIIAHRLSTISSADVIFVMKDGEIVEVGKHDELLKNNNGLYAHYNQLQSR